MNESDQSDGQLLAEFAATGSQTAFAEIVSRHGAMVQAVARRIVGDYHEAEDVTQAAFLTLARKASSLRKDSSVGAWLHHVAWCLAQDAWKTKRRRAGREAAAMRERELTDSVAVDPQAFAAELDAAINQLAERYRRPLVLFHLEGCTLEQTARRLNLNPSTTGNRLARGRELLRQKLVRRGVTVGSVGALTALLSAESGAAVLPATFVASTVSAATGGAVSTTVAALSQGALHAMFIAKVKTVSLAAAACLVVVGTSVVAAKQLGAPSGSVPRVEPRLATPALMAIPDDSSRWPEPVVTLVQQPPQPAAAVATDSKNTPSALQLSDLVRLTRGPNGLRAEWIDKTSPEKFGTFAVANPPLECSANLCTRFKDRRPGELSIEGANPAEFYGAGIHNLQLHGHGDYVWIRVIYGKQSPTACLEYIQMTNSARFIRTGRDGKNELDPSQQVNVTAANLTELQAQMGDKLDKYLVPMLALLGNKDVLGVPSRATTGDPTKVFKPIDATQSGMYGDGKWSYALEIKGDQRQGILKYNSKNVGNPQPGDYLLTPWGWMQWQEKGNWLPVAEKPAKGNQLADPAR